MDVDYTVAGAPPHGRLDNVVGWSLGVRRDMTRSFNIAAFIEGATATTPHEENPLEIRLEAEYRISKFASLVGGTSVGLTRSAADFAVSTGLRFRF